MPAELELTLPDTSVTSSPNLLPTPISSCFDSNRSVSGVSSISSHSQTSDPRRSVSGSASKRRGYVRLQGASFAPSAQQRESVQSLGSIAHLQYYFARTGLLDGKGGQMAKKNRNGEYDIPRLSLTDKTAASDSPVEDEGQLMWEAMQEDGDDVMLPPTVSTYSHRPNLAPPPDQKVLKRELVESLENALQALEACEKGSNESSEEATQGFYELQGMQVIDATTLAIRAARRYYMLHADSKRLNAIRPVPELRKELYNVLEILKTCAARNFEGGFREDERLSVLVWVSEVGMVIDLEAKAEEKERKARKDWSWMDGSKWVDNAAGRDIDFIHFLLRKAKPEGSDLPTGSDLFRSCADGRDLDMMHNVAVRESKRQFHLIETFHQDVAKPYRRADNLRYWIKGAELRFEIKLQFDVMAIANEKEDEAVWRKFEEAVRCWAEGVRLELTKDWSGEEERKLHARAKSLALASPFGSPAKLLHGKMNGRSADSNHSSPTPSPMASSENLPPVPRVDEALARIGLGLESPKDS